MLRQIPASNPHYRYVVVAGWPWVSPYLTVNDIEHRVSSTEEPANSWIARSIEVAENIGCAQEDTEVPGAVASAYYECVL